MLAHHQLPSQLKLFLANKNILKVGRSPNVDLGYLQQACQSSTPFLGGIDLAKMAKERQIITNARSCSLSDLTAIILQQQLPKNVSEHVSQAWDRDSLSDAARDYAVLDVLASKMIYERLVAIPIPGPLTADSAPGTEVLIFHADKTRMIATGSISSHAFGSSIDGINISPTRTVVQVNSVLVPGAIMNQHHKKTLRSFGPPPFNVVCLRSHLHIATASAPSSIHDSMNAGTKPPIIQEERPISSSDSSEQDSSADKDVDHVVDGVGDLLKDVESINVADLANIHPSTEHVSDPQSLLEGLSVLGDGSTSEALSKIRSRVLKDVFHVFNMLYISRMHGLRVEFSRALRDAIFIPDEQDKQRIIAWGLLQDPSQTWTMILCQNPGWLWRHCKRSIPPPEILHPLVKNVFHVYGPLKDAKTGLPLFNTAAWGVAKNILDLISKGFISDPPGIALYAQIGVDAKSGGLPIYRCMHGTSWTEGGVHTHLRSRLPTSGVCSSSCCLSQ
jgi:hypothetical protein